MTESAKTLFAILWGGVGAAVWAGGVVPPWDRAVRGIAAAAIRPTATNDMSEAARAWNTELKTRSGLYT